MSTVIQTLPDLPLFFSFFLFIYLLARFLLFRNWTPHTRPEASSCLISLFHGTPVVFLASRAVLSDSGRGFSSPNTSSQNAALDFSIAYFLMDLSHYIVFLPGDVLFIAHHVGTLFVLATCRYLVSRGACAVLPVLVLAEVTSACQNSWTLAGARRGDSEFAAWVYRVLSPPFYAFYSVVRGVLGPYFVFRMGEFYLFGNADNLVPMWVWVSWITVMVTSIGVSIMWVANLWVELYRERRGKNDKKL